MDAVARDDELLDLLGAGQHPDSDDPAIQALRAWRAEISTGLDDGRPPVPVNGHRAHQVREVVTPLNSEAHTGWDGTGHRARHRPPRRRRSMIAVVAVGLSAGLSGVAVAAADADPGSPLWPITKVIYSDTAAERQAEADAEAALDRARRALAEGRVEDAKRYLDEANRRAGAVRSGEADKLRDDLDAMRSQIEQKQTDETSAEPSDPPDDPEEPSDAEVSPTPEVPSSTTSPGSKDGKGKGDPGGKNRQGVDRELDATSPEPTSGEVTTSPTAL
jgi:hypothetical protein